MINARFSECSSEGGWKGEFKKNNILDVLDLYL